MGQAQSGELDVRPPAVRGSAWRETQRLSLIARLHHLEQLGLATEIKSGRWEIDSDLIERLTALGQRDVLVKQLAHHVGEDYRFRDIAIYRKDEPAPPMIVGEVLGRGKVDELAEYDYLLVASIEGESAGNVYRVAMSQFSEHERDPIARQQIVRIHVYQRPAVAPSDHNIAQQASRYQGVYSVERHLELTEAKWKSQGRADENPEPYVERHAMRAEGLVRRHLIEKMGEGLYKVPPDLIEQLQTATASERDRGRSVQLQPLSHLTVDQQVRAWGPTWLDGQLARGTHLRAAFGAEESSAERRLSSALLARVEALALRGIDVRQRALTGPELERLYNEELRRAAMRLAATYGQFIEAQSLEKNASGSLHLRGRVAAIERLASGVHVVVAQPNGFALLPARAVSALKIGAEVKVDIRAASQVDIERARSAQMNVRYTQIDRQRGRERGLELAR